MKIVVTGSSSGIGRHLVSALLADGHQVWGWARSDQSGWAHGLDATGLNLRTSRIDVSDWEAVKVGAEEVSNSWLQIDGLICCAGIQGEIGDAMKTDPLEWEKTVCANLSGVFFTLRGVFQALCSGNRVTRAKVIVFSGGGATKPRANFSAYAVAKTGVVRLVETLAEEWRDLPIDINTIAPGAIYTAMTEEVIRLGPGIVGASEYAGALKLKGQTAEGLGKVTALIKFLLSAQSDHLSGRLLSAAWDSWQELSGKGAAFGKSEVYTLRRITP
jgi:NAD(P)-dependent dehydrogenase (short-subunit alcohol dehydrogenase family)